MKVAPRPARTSDAALEHEVEVTWRSSMTTIERHFGSGVRMYFRYVGFMRVYCLVLATIGLLAYLIASDELLNQYKNVEMAYFGAWPNKALPLWYGATITASVMSLFVGPAFHKVQSRQEALAQQQQDASAGPAAATSTAVVDDIIQANRQVSKQRRFVRRVLSGVMFCGLVALQGFLVWLVHQAFGDRVSDTVPAIIIALMVNALAKLWAVAGRKLTEFERHPTLTVAKEWDTTKLFVLKILNIVVLYIVKDQNQRDVADNCTEDSTFLDCRCPLLGMGQQFFWILVLDLTVANAMEVILPTLRNKYRARKAKHSGVGDDQLKERFDLANEYVEVIYRQFVVLLGFPVFPAIALLGFLAFTLEFHVDKYRLTSLCRVPTLRERPLSSRIIFALHLLVSVVALFSYPNGALWMWRQNNLENCNVVACFVTDGVCE